MFLKTIKARREEAFTLVELLITVVILAVIMGIAIPVYVNNKASADSVAAKTQVTLIVDAISSGIGTGDLQLIGFSAVLNTAPYTVASGGFAGPNSSITSQVGTQTVKAGTKVFRTGDNFCVSNGTWAKLSSGPLQETTSDCANTTTIGGLGLVYGSGVFTSGGNSQVIAAPVVTNGTGSETFSITIGSLPAGVTFNTATGTFTGPISSAWNFIATQITGGDDHTCALTSLGGVKCWGYNGQGQLGNGTVTQSLIPINVTGLTSGVASISAGRYHTCAVTTSGGAKCWGWNAYGQIGDNTTIDKLIPTDVIGLTSGVASIGGTGAYHTCAVTTGGAAKCWGYNVQGQLGDGSGLQQNTQVQVSGLTSGISKLTAGMFHTCALTTGGGAKCWGSGGSGMLGNGGTTQQNTPVDVSGLLSGVTMITAGGGGQSTCALTSAGGVKCWGRNDSGQVGDNTIVDKLVPTDVSGLTSGVASIANGQFQSCAVLNTSGVKCWGRNASGQLGDNSLIQRNTPVDVSGLTTGVTMMAGGVYRHACVIVTGAVKCWGSNAAGAIGDNTIIDKLTPVNVSPFIPQPGFPVTITVQATGGNGTNTANITLSAS